MLDGEYLLNRTRKWKGKGKRLESETQAIDLNWTHSDTGVKACFFSPLLPGKSISVFDEMSDVESWHQEEVYSHGRGREGRPQRQTEQVVKW